MSTPVSIETVSPTDDQKLAESALRFVQAHLINADPSRKPYAGEEWQQKRSIRTRKTLLEAAVACMAETGYASTSTQSVADKAEVSRGAMLHHFSTKLDLMTALTDHIHYAWLTSFYDRVYTLTPQERMVDGLGLEIYWSLLNSKEGDAHLQLNLAARTDPALGEMFYPRWKAADQIYDQVIPMLFPEWREVDVQYTTLASDLVRTSLMGLHLNRDFIDDPERRLALRKFVFAQAQCLRK